MKSDCSHENIHIACADSLFGGRGLAQETPFGARITVWRPYSPVKSLALHQQPDTTKAALTLFGPDDIFQQEAFVWHALEDVWGSIVNSEVRQTLSERLRNDFQPSLPPLERGLQKLRRFLDDARLALPEAEWSDSAQRLERDGMTAYRLNALLAFCVQLEWIHDIFKDVPGASVSVQ